MKNLLKLFSGCLIFFFLCGCPQKEEPVPELKIPREVSKKREKKIEEPEIYIYRPFPFNPFDCLVEVPEKTVEERGREKEEKEKKIPPLTLKGIIYGAEKHALLIDNAGEYYFIKNGKLYDWKRKEIANYKAIVKPRSVIIIDKKEQKKQEIKIRELN